MKSLDFYYFVLFCMFLILNYDELGNASSAADYFDVKTLPSIIWVLKIYYIK